ncbi:MAG TPA: alpha/beta hydrolase [Nocardioides sp.]|jgi:pimeloyl-ACP methyl ester carboxylesterase
MYGMVTERHVDLDIGRIRVREAGDGPPVVLVHGALVNGHLWDDVIPLLADRHRVIAPDLPLGAHAEPVRPGAPLGLRAQADVVADLVSTLRLDDVTLVGNDTGGAVCQLVVTRRPDGIGRLVLTSCDAFDNCPPRFFRFLVWSSYVPASAWLLAQTMRSPRLARLPVAFGRLTHRGLEKDRLDRMFAPVRRSRGVRRDQVRLLRSIDAADTQAAAAALGGVTIPVLIAWSADDRIFPPEHASRLAALLPDATLSPIPDSLAFSPIDQPDALAQRVTEFVTGSVRG